MHLESCREDSGSPKVSVAEGCSDGLLLWPEMTAWILSVQTVQ